jgi:hypothetical protein
MKYFNIGPLLFILFPLSTSAQSACVTQLQAQEYKYVNEIMEMQKKHQYELDEKESRLQLMTLERQLEQEKGAKSRIAGIAIGTFFGGIFFLTTVLFLILFLVKNSQLRRTKIGY